MNYYLYKMNFTTPLHSGSSETARSLENSGMNICADTLFSALYHTALLCEGIGGIHWLYERAIQSELLFSDLFPYKHQNYYIPKPYLISQNKIEISSEQRKKMKKLTHIPINMMDEFLCSIRGDHVFDTSKIDSDFGNSDVSAKVAIRGFEEAQPYNVGYFNFNDDCGLYGIIRYEKRSDLETLIHWLQLLSYSGIGGKISSGYGKFNLISFDDEPSAFLLKDLLSKDYSHCHYLSLTTSLPQEHELELSLQGATYSMSRRGGFIASSNFSIQNRKKDTQYFFSSGSVFTNKFTGDVYEVGTGGNHKVYRYSKPIFLGVKI